MTRGSTSTHSLVSPTMSKLNWSTSVPLFRTRTFASIDWPGVTDSCLLASDVVAPMDEQCRRLGAPGQLAQGSVKGLPGLPHRAHPGVHYATPGPGRAGAGHPYRQAR